MLVASVFAASMRGRAEVQSGGPEREEVLAHLQAAAEAGARALLETGTDADLAAFAAHYDRSGRSGRWAIDHEIEKVRYFREWARRRAFRFVEANVRLLPWQVRVKGDKAQVYFSHSLQLGYVYADEREGATVNRFGIGTRHSAQLVRSNDRWLIQYDWYTSPMGEPGISPAMAPVVENARAVMAWWDRMWLPGERDVQAGALRPPPGEVAGVDLAEEQAAGRKRYDREAAVAYADRYCGDAWGCGNNHRYNREKYRDYDGIGGDCTNFVSQVLGPDGGGLRMDGAWYYRGKGASGAGSTAWVQSQALANYLVYSGRGRLLARDAFPNLTKPTSRFPEGAVRALELGDVIAYNEKGHIDHLAVVTAFDSRGYPLVNSHTADRYHVPWDLGWDKRTVYWLIHVRD